MPPSGATSVNKAISVSVLTFIMVLSGLLAAGPWTPSEGPGPGHPIGGPEADAYPPRDPVQDDAGEDIVHPPAGMDSRAPFGESDFLEIPYEDFAREEQPRIASFSRKGELTAPEHRPGMAAGH